MELLDKYFEIQKQIYNYFGYKEDWRIIPLENSTEMFWILDEDSGFVRFAETEDKLFSNGDYYKNAIYTQRFLPRWVYPAKDYTMICVDTHTDGNKFLQVFDNSKKRNFRGK